ncbi:MAG: hybrid sensor histidine kinase/response regulator, partial [Myxococcota bacterium]
AEIQPRSFEAHGLLADIAKSFELEAEKKNVVISVAGPRIRLYADPVMLKRVVVNLLSNAVHHSSTDRVLLATRRRPDACWIQVWDQGRGIEPEDQLRVFEEFEQLSNPQRNRDHGYGLGLSIVQSICSASGWTVEIKSEVGRGSVFTIRIPVRLAESPVIPDAMPPEVGELRVLIVEDDPLVRRGLEQSLSAWGATVASVDSAPAALESLATGPPFDVVLSDRRLPGATSGEDLVEQLTSRSPPIPCVLLSGDDISASHRFRQYGPNLTLLQKPVSIPNLCGALLASQNGVEHQKATAPTAAVARSDSRPMRRPE